MYKATIYYRSGHTATIRCDSISLARMYLFGRGVDHIVMAMPGRPSLPPIILRHSSDSCG
jgi:hypothetical protein